MRRSLLVSGLSAASRDTSSVRFAARLVDRLARLEPAAQEQPAIGAAIEPRRAGRRRHRVVHADRLDVERRRHRHPHLGRQDRHHAVERRPARRRRSCTGCRESAACGRPHRAPSQLARPVAPRHHHHARRAGHVVGGKNRPPEAAPTPKHLEVVAGDDLAHRQPRAAVEVQRGEHRAVADEAIEHVVLRAQVLVVGVRRGAERDLAGGIAGEHVDQPARARRPAAA